MIHPDLEPRVGAYALKFLEQGRVGWDVKHTQAVVHYALLLANQEHLDELTLFTAAWFHDTGYFSLFDDANSHSWEAIADRKKLHMVHSAAYVHTFLSDPSIAVFYTQKQVLRVQHLVRMHDEVELLNDPDEVALGVADTLGTIDVSRVTPTFDYPSYQKYRSNGLKRRERLFQSRATRRLYDELISAFETFFENRRETS